MKSQDSRSDLPLTLPYGSNWGHKIADSVFLSYIYFIIAVELYNVLRGIGKPFVKSLDSRPRLPPDPPPPPPPPPPMGQTGVIK